MLSSTRSEARISSTASVCSPTEDDSSASGWPRVRARMSRGARSLWTRNNSLHGVFLGGALLSEYARVHPMIGDMLQLVADGELQVEIDRSFPLSDATVAHEYAESRKAFGRVIITP